MGIGRNRSATAVARKSTRYAGPKKRNPLRGLFWATYLLIVLTVGRIVDIVPVLSSLPLVKIALLYVVFALMAYWKLLPAVVTADNPAVKWAMAFAIWIVVSFSFSIWLGPSRDFILVQLPILSVVVLLICKLSGDWEPLRNIYLSLVISALIQAVPGLLAFGGGRLALNATYDTNELAYMLDGIIPAALAFSMTEASRKRRMFFFGATGIMIVAVILTGSRGGIFGLLFAGLFTVLDPGRLRPHAPAFGRAPPRKVGMSAKTRIVLVLAACAVIGTVAWPQLPKETKERLASMLNLGSDYNIDEKEGRVQIWKRGLNALAERPIGFGIGSYPMVDYKNGGLFYTAHNSLVLVTVELGPVGIVIYLTLLACLWRGLARIRRLQKQLREPSDLQQQQAVFCRMLQASLVANFVAGMFLSATYYYGHWVNIALAMAFIAFMNRQKLEPNLEPNGLVRR
jgi:hypothetical protein